MRLAGDGIPIFGINYKDRPEDAQRFLSELGNPYRAISRDDVSALQMAIGSSGVPE